MFTSIKGFTKWLGRETKTTATVLASLNDAGLSFRPHAKSRTAGELAWHLVTAPRWFVGSCLKLSLKDEFDRRWPTPPKKVSAIVEAYELSSATCLQAVESKDDAWLAKQTDFIGRKMPRGAVLSLLLLHEIHHRGQLSAYLRPLGAKVPSIYGPSGDA